MSGHSPVMDAGIRNIFLYQAHHVGIPGMLFFVSFVVRVILKPSEEYRQAYHFRDQLWCCRLILGLRFDQMLAGSLSVLFELPVIL